MTGPTMRLFFQALSLTKRLARLAASYPSGSVERLRFWKAHDRALHRLHRRTTAMGHRLHAAGTGR
jgi:hypothetical protein